MLKLKNGHKINTFTDYYAAFCLNCNSGLEFQFQYNMLTDKTGIFVSPCNHCLKKSKEKVEENIIGILTESGKNRGALDDSN